MTLPRRHESSPPGDEEERAARRRPDFACWPDLRVVVRFLPWTWRLTPFVYVDDVFGARGYWSVTWLALTVEWCAPSPGPMFPTLGESERDAIDELVDEVTGGW